MSTPLGHHRGIRRAIATVCLSGMLEDKLDAVAGAGFDGVEIFENDLIASPSTPAGVTHSSTHRLRGRWRLIRDGVQLAKPAAREMIWSKSDTFRPGDPRAASQPRIAAGCVARLPRESRRLGKSAADASAWPRHHGRPQLESSLCRPVPTVPRGRARSTGPRSRHPAMAEIQPREVR